MPVADNAEEIAKVVADLRRGRVLNGAGGSDPEVEVVAMAKLGEVVDVTAVYNRMKNMTTLIDIYGDHSLCPPWDVALISFVNQWGNVVVMLTSCIEQADIIESSGVATKWETQNEVDWDSVKWIYDVTPFMGGWSNTNHRRIETIGPLLIWRIAVYADGTPADIHWIHLRKDLKEGVFDTDMNVWLQTITLANCVNVEVVEPLRPRPAQRRISRTGVEVREIHVRPISKSYRGKDGPPLSSGVPLTSVRGHFAKYGSEHGRKLLFGKYSGRFWIPAHARGTAELGESEHTYVIESESG